MKSLLLTFLKLYQKFISPVLFSFMGSSCRFNPTCSEYSKIAISRYGAAKGLKLSLARISKCHPFYKGEGFDPVPNKI